MVIEMDGGCFCFSRLPHGNISIFCVFGAKLLMRSDGPEFWMFVTVA